MKYCKMDVRKPAESQNILQTQYFCFDDDADQNMLNTALVKRCKITPENGRQGFVTFLLAEDWDKESGGAGWYIGNARMETATIVESE